MRKSITSIYAALLLMFSFSAQAVVIDYIDTHGTNSGEPLRSVIHTAESNYSGFNNPDNQSGDILAFITLDTSTTSTWDLLTGAINININLTDFGGTNILGTASGTGTLDPNDFNGDGGLFGSIDWSFDADASNLLGGITSLTTYFEDTSYGGTNSNSYDGEFLYLWGADGYDPLASDEVHSELGDIVQGQSTFGMDLTIHTVPVPASIWLFVTGLIGLVGVVRRRA